MKKASFYSGILVGCLLTLFGTRVLAQTNGSNGTSTQNSVVQR